MTLTNGNTLIQDAGLLPINAASDLANPDFKPVETSSKLDAPARIANLGFDGASEGEIITLRLQARGSSLSPILINGEGGFLDPQMTYFESDSVLAVYQFTGKAPYHLTLMHQAPTRSASMKAIRYWSMVVRCQQVCLEQPYTNELPKTARFVTHTLDVASGQLITFQVENSRKVVPVALHDGKGQLIEPALQDFQGGSNNVNIYILSGSGPYTATFPITGKYTASVAALNLLRVDKGLVTFGSAY